MDEELYYKDDIDGPEIVFPEGIDEPEPTPENTSYPFLPSSGDRVTDKSSLTA